MRRFFFLSLLAAIVGLSGVAVAWSAVQHGKSPSQMKLEHNRRAARVDALHIIRSIALPAGTHRTTPVKEHRGFAIAVVMTSYTASAKYLAPAGVNAYRYVLHHHPHGTKVSPGGTYTVTKNGKRTLTARDLSITFPNRPGVLFARGAFMSFRKLSSGETEVSVVSQSSWVLPRPSAERVPQTATQVAVSGTSTGKHTGSSWAISPITTPATVSKLIKLVDRPGIIQDVAISCPEAPGPDPFHAVTLEYENASGTALATVSASWSGRASLGATGTECNPINFNLGKHTEPELLDQRFLVQLHRLLGVNLDG